MYVFFFMYLCAVQYVLANLKVFCVLFSEVGDAVKEDDVIGEVETDKVNTSCLLRVKSYSAYKETRSLVGRATG